MTRTDLNALIQYLREMNTECINETGWDMSVNDVIGHLECEEFAERFIEEVE